MDVVLFSDCWESSRSYKGWQNITCPDGRNNRRALATRMPMIADTRSKRRQSPRAGHCQFIAPHGLVTECIESFYDELEGDSAVVIVDNASGNGSVEHLRAWASGNTVRAWCSSSSPRATEDSRLATISEFAVSKRRTICSSTAIQFSLRRHSKIAEHGEQKSRCRNN